MPQTNVHPSISFEEFKKETLNDFHLACLSREASLLGRKEVLTGKAKFGIFGDGKEVAQLAMARVFREGDFRSGYYRDQTFMFASGMSNLDEFFAQLYAIPDVNEDPASAGRQMNGHFATRSLDEKGNWKELKNMKNCSADTSPTASQMARAVGLALASKVYRENELLQNTPFSHAGNEVTFVTIGDSSTSEGLFWEALNAAGVMKIPMAVFVWDDGYGISVPQKYQTTKENISEITAGFQLDDEGRGIRIYEVKGWDYPSLMQTFEEGIKLCREEHIPVLFHVKEITQPQGHSTSGSHERYKNKERLEWEEKMDCIKKMQEWLVSNSIATNEELEKIQEEAKLEARAVQKTAWAKYLSSIKADIDVAFSLLDDLAAVTEHNSEVRNIKEKLQKTLDPSRRDVMKALKSALYVTAGEVTQERDNIISWLKEYETINFNRYNSHLHSHSELATHNIKQVPAQYADDAPLMNGFEILNRCFDAHFEKNPYLFAFGEDLGKIGDVNQGFAGLQDKYGEKRIFDTGIREATIIGQGIGMSMRGLRPIAEIQYLDYLIYGLQPMTDDLATLQYRTRGGQKAPMIIRTRGHRLEGIWHTGSPMSMIINSCRGIYVCVPRNMVQAAGFYNLLLKSDEPGLIIECLNGYRLKEKLPSNISDFTVPLGVPEILQEGEDITVVSYGSNLRVVKEAIEMLEEKNISVELIDAQTLLPFDTTGVIGESIKKTNRIVFIDEDVPGGATAYMMQQVFTDTSLFKHLDSLPQCISAKAHRSAYASDGDYFSKPNAEEIYETIYNMMHEVSPGSWPGLG
ncbi:MAG: thiamine pyrophosphate-dependent enzyme [Chitinophagales bacterium]